MNTSNETVADRIEAARGTVGVVQAATIITFAAAITFTLIFLQDPVAHDSMHNFRHAAGITCH